MSYYTIHNDKNNTYFCRRSLEVNSSSLTLRAFRKRNVSTTTNVVVDNIKSTLHIFECEKLFFVSLSERG